MRTKIIYFFLGILVSGIMIFSVNVFGMNISTSTSVSKPVHYFLDGKEQKLSDGLVYNNEVYVPVTKLVGLSHGRMWWSEKDSTLFAFSTDIPHIDYGKTQTKTFNIDEFKFIKKWMSFKEVYDKVGPPTIYDGSGIVTPEYLLEDGGYLTFYLAPRDSICYAYIRYKDGSKKYVIS